MMFVCSQEQLLCIPFPPICQAFSVKANYLLHALPTQAVLTPFLCSTSNFAIAFKTMHGLLVGDEQQQNNQPISNGSGAQLRTPKQAAPALGYRLSHWLSTIATSGFGGRTLLETHNRLSCPRSADTASKN